ncbi:MAG TPA: hypothetical protein VEK57_14285 [Thermoanaerobaculia bacterium]|nr:hypothetical protein [Thermoanaerobaculia bacterium]
MVASLLLALAVPALAADDCRTRLASKRTEAGRAGVYFFGISFVVPAKYTVADAKKAETLLKLFAEVSAAFEARGTTLVLVPVPPKPVVMRQYLSPLSEVQRNYDHAEVARLYLRFIRSMNDGGVAAVDVLTPLRKFDWRTTWELPNMANEQHWSATGARLSAQAVAARLAKTEKYRSLPKVALRLREENPATTSFAQTARGAGKTVLDVCGVEIRAESIPQFSIEDPQTTLFSDPVQGAVLLGTSYSDDLFSFEKFLAEALQLRVTKVAGDGRGLFGALEHALAGGYLTTGAYPYVIWEFPFLELASNSQDVIASTLKQVVANLNANCTGAARKTGIPIDAASGEVVVDIRALRPETAGSDEYLIVEVQEPVGEFRISAADDPAPLAVVRRSPRSTTSGRYYFKVSEGHLPRASIRITFADSTLVQGKTISVALCGGN